MFLQNIFLLKNTKFGTGATKIHCRVSNTNFERDTYIVGDWIYNGCQLFDASEMQGKINMYKVPKYIQEEINYHLSNECEDYWTMHKKMKDEISLFKLMILVKNGFQISNYYASIDLISDIRADKYITISQRVREYFIDYVKQLMNYIANTDDDTIPNRENAMYQCTNFLTRFPSIFIGDIGHEVFKFTMDNGMSILKGMIPDTQRYDHMLTNVDVVTWDTIRNENIKQMLSYMFKSNPMNALKIVSNCKIEFDVLACEIPSKYYTDLVQDANVHYLVKLQIHVIRDDIDEFKKEFDLHKPKNVPSWLVSYVIKNDIHEVYEYLEDSLDQISSKQILMKLMQIHNQIKSNPKRTL